VDAVAEALLEFGEELGVDLDGGEVVRECDELLGQDAFAGADLEDELVRLRLDGGDDLVHRAAVAEEVLGPLFLRWHSRVRTGPCVTLSGEGARGAKGLLR